MDKIVSINVYPPTVFVDISKESGNIKDNDLPVLESIDVVLVPNALIGSYGYITKNFKNIEKIVSPRHRNTIGFKSILSNYFLKKRIKIEMPAISIANGWYDNFYHFSLECLVKLYVLKDYLNDGTVVFPSKHSHFHQQWFDILGIENILYIHENEIVKTPKAISCNFPNRDLNHHNMILPEFKNWVLSKIENKQVIKSTKIFVGRAAASKRNLKNLKELMCELEKMGFEYVEMENYLVAEQINIFRNATQIVAVHGAALTHLTFCNANTKAIDLIHEEFKHQFCFLKLSKILNISYQLVPCKGDEAAKDQSGYKDITVDVNTLINIVKQW